MRIYYILLSFLGYIDLIWGFYFLFFPIPVKIDLFDIIIRILLAVFYVLSANAIWEFSKKGKSIRIPFYNMPVSVIFRFVIVYFVFVGSVKPWKTIDYIAYLMLLHVIIISIIWAIIIFLRRRNDAHL